MWIEGIGNDVLCRSSKIKGVSNFLLDYIKKSKELNCGTALTSLGQHPQHRCHKDERHCAPQVPVGLSFFWCIILLALTVCSDKDCDKAVR